MTKEEKQLLLIDLCGRLPYDNTIVRVEILDENHAMMKGGTQDDELSIMWVGIVAAGNPYHIIKPYLRSMSSMTEEEKEQLAIIRSEDFRLVRQWVKNESIKETGTPCPVTCGEIDYCNKKHLDYRGLIPMGLALEAPEGMYK